MAQEKEFDTAANDTQSGTAAGFAIVSAHGPCFGAWCTASTFNTISREENRAYEATEARVCQKDARYDQKEWEHEIAEDLDGIDERVSQ